ncbi:MAG TPA: four helix bundle protein [Gemmatimonadaceae bacterium]|nr:four helix bundle protein [Gemmatimonadaceae bacterium]
MKECGLRGLIVWRRAAELATEIHRLAKRLPPQESFGLASQLRRAAASVPANIAEGKGRSSPADYCRFLSIARGSLLELESHLEMAVRFEYLTAEDTALALDLLSQVRRLLARLSQSLKPKRDPSSP